MTHLPPFRILVAVCSCHKYPEKRQAVRETWFSNEVDGVVCRFFVGRGDTENMETDTIEVDAGDSYEELPSKVLSLFRHALEHFEFDWLFKCDDDTYLSLERLKKIVHPGISLLGNETLDQRGFPSGGAGYLLSRELVKLLAADSTLPSTGAEDVIIGEAAIRHGAVPQSTRLLNWRKAPFPMFHNSMVSAHWCTPQQMRAIHVFCTTKPVGRYRVEHRRWKDDIHLHDGDLFYRISSGCTGIWNLTESGELSLKWFDWAEENAKQTGIDCYIGPRMKITPISPKIPPTLVFGSVGDEQSAVLTWLGGPHDVAVVYYGDDDEHHLASTLPKRVDYFNRRKGGKFQNLLWWMDENPDAAQRYEWFLVCDDDIQLSSSQIATLVQEAARLNLPVSAPSHDPRGKISWQHMKHKPGRGVAFCNFVEMTCVLFQRDALLQFLKVFRPASPYLTGWGTDFVISKACYQSMRPFGVIHSVKVFNPRRSPGTGIEKLQNSAARQRAWAETARRFDLAWNQKVGEVLRPGPNPKVVCINLERATERRAQMNDLWKPIFGDDLKFFTAVDRRDLEAGTVPMPAVRVSSRSPGCGRDLTLGEKACLMSHLGVMTEHLPELGEEGIIIMEDDIIPSVNASRIFEVIRQARLEAPHIDMILLCQPVNTFGKWQASSLLWMPKEDSFPYGNTMVWYGPGAVADYLDEMGGFTRPADHRQAFCRVGRVGVLKSPAALHRGADTFVGNEYRGSSAQRTFRA